MNELRDALVLASDEELDILIDVLFRPRFNPLDYLQTASTVELKQLPYGQRLKAIEDRICFLAADGLTTLRGQALQLDYRTILLQACDYLKISHGDRLSSEDLEAELFLEVLQRTVKRLPPGERSRLSKKIYTALHVAPEAQHWPDRLQQDHIRLTLEGGSALAINAVVRPLLLKHMAHQVMLHVAKRQVAQEALKQGGVAVARLQGYVATQMASRGVTVSLARYAAARSILNLVGPALWVWFLADLGWRAIATNHGRTIPALFLLAQIRLTRVASSAKAS